VAETETTVELTMSAEQLEDFARLLTNYRTPGDIEMLAVRILGEKPADISDKARTARETVSKMQSRGRIPQAVELLFRESHPSGPMVLGLRHILNGNRLDSDAALQSLLNYHEPFLSSAEMIDLLPKVARRVCAVGLDENLPGPKIRGTGFLIAPDIVITNYHVVTNFLEEDKATGEFKQKEPGSKLFFFFDYLHAPTPLVPPNKERHVVAVNAAANWYLKARPALDKEGTEDCAKQLSEKHELDYVLIRLEKPLGLSSARTGGGVIRGWLPLEDSIEPSPRRILVIQHPQAQPQLFDIGNYESGDPTGSRVWYSVSTAHGSSGGAALDTEGRLFALHNASVTARPNVNQGVRIDFIAKDVAAIIPKDPVPDDDGKLMWSLNDDFENSQPIMGRSKFREYVARMSNISSPERALVVTGTPPNGLRYSIKLLTRLRMSDTPAAEFPENELRDDLGQGFLQRVVNELNIGSAAPWPKKETEADARWVEGVANWLADAVARDYEVNRTKYPAWMVINTVGTDNKSISLPKDLMDLIARLLGRKNDAQPPLDVPQLRWLFLALPGATLPLAGISRLDEELKELSERQAAREFAACFINAYKSIDKEATIPEEFLEAMAGDLLDENDKKVQKDTKRKALAEYVRRLLAKHKSQ
jgi:hypothetical protein